MKTIGLIGGMSWESTVPYYRQINETIKSQLGGLHSARLVLVSVDFHEIEVLQRAGDWEAAGEAMAQAARSLARAGADFMVLCTNTMHKVADAIESAVQIPLLHIADPTAARIRQAGLGKVGLLGTRFTMEQAFYKGRLTGPFGLEVLVPQAAERELVHRIIYDELCLGEVRGASRAEYLAIIAGLAEAGAEAVKMAAFTLQRMAEGGIHDHVGGGFHRYSVDEKWLVPHFEKMLYDNAQLAQLYLDAFLASGESRYADTVRGILDYVLRDMTHPDGGFYSAEDADSEGQEGKFYCWTHDELSKLLAPEEFNVAARRFGITKSGNFIDHSHPDPLPGLNVLSIVNATVADADKPLLASAISKMQKVRAARVRPHLDDKILSSWNGLMLGAFARASAVLNEPRYLAAAEKNLAFIREKLWQSASESAIGNRQFPLALCSTVGATVNATAFNCSKLTRRFWKASCTSTRPRWNRSIWTSLSRSPKR